MLDLSVASDLQVEFLGPDRGSNAEFMAEMMNEFPHTIPGVSDGGAHTKFFTGGSYTTDFLSWLVRDEEKVTLEEAHYKLSNLPAQAAGLHDRGILREGFAGDIIVYDLDKLGLQYDSPIYDDDFPGGERRLIQKAKGIRFTLVNGEVTFTEGTVSPSSSRIRATTSWRTTISGRTQPEPPRWNRGRL